ncbi:MAG: hypothetical protein HY760_06855 [Nitrospirae bacterium]|nr:hypothetical protein [Nitrospirota bacterium]
MTTREYGRYELMKFTVWGMIVGFVGSIVVATTMLGLDNLYWDTVKFLKFLVVVGWSMIAGAGIGVVYDLLRHTWEPELRIRGGQIEEGSEEEAEKEAYRKAA